MRAAPSLAAWADGHARREPRGLVALLVTALVSTIAWWRLLELAEDAYWHAARLPNDYYPWIEIPGATAVCLRLLAGFAPLAAGSALLARRVAGARAATAAWVSLTILGAVCVAPAYADLGFRSPVEQAHGQTCTGTQSFWTAWWFERFFELGYEWAVRVVWTCFKHFELPWLRWAASTLALVTMTALVVKSARRLGPRCDSLVRLTSRAAVALSAAMLVASCATLLTRPTEYVSTLPVIATLRSEQELLASGRLTPATPMAITNRYGFSVVAEVDDIPTSSANSFQVDHSLGALTLRQVCHRLLGDVPHVYCNLYWRAATWPRWVRSITDPVVHLQPHERVEVRLDHRTRTAFLTVGPRVIAGLHLDAMPTRADWEVQHPDRWFVTPPRAWVTLSQLPVAPDRAIVALALAGLLTTLLLRAFDHAPPSIDEIPRGYRDAAAPPRYDAARINAWLRDDALEPSWRALAVLSLTHAPLVAWFATRG